MRKLFYAMALVLLSIVTYGQAVNESAIIPVSVTMNSVSRLNVESGGNIKFVFTSIDDYNTGFTGATSSLYQTTVSVSSSRDYDINMYAEGATFVPTDNGANSLAIGQLEYTLDWTGDAANEPTTYNGAIGGGAFVEMTNTNPTLIIDGGIAGNGTDNRFVIWWRIGTSLNTLGTFLDQGNIAADHYTTNIFIELVN